VFLFSFLFLIFKPDFTTYKKHIVITNFLYFVFIYFYFDQAFIRFNMSPVDFYKLMNKATRREVLKGEKLLKEGEFNSQIHIILSGHVS